MHPLPRFLFHSRIPFIVDIITIVIMHCLIVFLLFIIAISIFLIVIISFGCAVTMSSYTILSSSFSSPSPSVLFFITIIIFGRSLSCENKTNTACKKAYVRLRKRALKAFRIGVQSMMKVRLALGLGNLSDETTEFV